MGRQTFKKQITSPEILAQINKDNLKLCQIYLRDKQRKCSDDTIKQYQSALNIFFCWNVIENENKFYPQIKKIEISMFFDYLLNLHRHPKYQPSTTNPNPYLPSPVSVFFQIP